MSKLFLHEDFYLQIELVPDENIFSLINVNDNFDTSNMYGYYNINERKGNKIELIQKKINIREINFLLDDLEYIHYNNIYIGYNNNSRLMINTIAYGFERFAIFFEYDNDYVIKKIWLNQENDLNTNNKGKNLLAFLNNLGVNFQLILVDWNNEILVNLSNQKSIKEYLINNYYFDI